MCHSILIIVLPFSNPVTISVMEIVKLREREGQWVDLGRSLKGHL